LGDWSDFFTVIHLSRPIAKTHYWLAPLDWTLMHADGSVAPSIQRLGIRWRVNDTPGPVDYWTTKIGLAYSVSFHLLESDGTGIQMVHVYRWNLVGRRLYVSGFAHQDMNYDGQTTWVTEHQIGLRLVDQLHAVAEFRYNDFRPKGLRSGWGLGLQYVIRFE